MLRALLAGLWFGLIPLLGSALALRYLVPHSVATPGLEGAFARLGRDHTLLLVLFLFVIASAVIRYWRAFLPGGRFLSALPAELVERVPRRRVPACEDASSLLRWLEGGTGQRWLDGLSPEQQAELRRAQTQLLSGLDAGKWSRVGAACTALRKLTGGAQARASVRKTLSFAASLAVAALLALSVRAIIFQSYEVIGNSMLPSLAAGDLLAGNLLSAAQVSRLARGDVVVLRTRVDGHEQELIKRVIGLPGDHIDMRGVHPVINGWKVPVCDAGAYYSPDDATAAERADPGGRVAVEFLGEAAYLTFQAAPGAPLSEYVVKPGELFLLGDNRNNSRDSRAFDEGAPRGFPLAEVKAKVQRVLLSRTRSGSIDPESVGQRLGLALHLDGVDVSEVEAGIRRCIAARPLQTKPPKSSASQALATGGQ